MKLSATPRTVEPVRSIEPGKSIEPVLLEEASDLGKRDRPDKPFPPDDATDRAIETALWTLLDRRAVDATVCPSEVARSIASAAADWRALMPSVRAVAKRLAGAGLLRVTRQGHEVIDATAGGGPIRLGRPHGAREPREPHGPREPREPRR